MITLVLLNNGYKTLMLKVFQWPIQAITCHAGEAGVFLMAYVIHLSVCAC